jgi:hypothetical protein
MVVKFIVALSVALRFRFVIGLDKGDVWNMDSVGENVDSVGESMDSVGENMDSVGENMAL